MAAAAALILTLAFDEPAFAYFERLRQRHFPPERNFLPAHLTLFHHLSGVERPAIEAELAALAAVQAPLVLEVDGVRFLGRGVAFTLHSPGLARVRQRLAAAWQPWLGAQDRQPFRPHVTIQNKVDPDSARELRDLLLAGFGPFAVEGRGLRLWRYLGGPWEALLEVPFAGR
jgi:2'-5' RNA ligase